MWYYLVEIRTPFRYYACPRYLQIKKKWIGLIQSVKKWKHQFFRCLSAANSVVGGQIWPNFKLTQALIMSSLPVSMKRIPSRTTENKWQHRFSNYNTICCHGNGNQWSDLAEFRSHPSSRVCYYYLQV